MNRRNALLWIAFCCVQPWLPKGQGKLLRNSDIDQVDTSHETVAHLDDPRQLKKKKDEDEQDKNKVDVTYDEPTAEEEEYVDPPKHEKPKDKVAPAEVNGDFRTVDHLLASFQPAKARLLERIKAEYGEDHFELLFMDDSPAFPMPNGEDKCTIGRNSFLKGSENSQKSWARTVRKMKINLLQYLIEGKVQDFVWATA